MSEDGLETLSAPVTVASVFPARTGGPGGRDHRRAACDFPAAGHLALEASARHCGRARTFSVSRPPKASRVRSLSCSLCPSLDTQLLERRPIQELGTGLAVLAASASRPQNTPAPSSPGPVWRDKRGTLARSRYSLARPSVLSERSPPASSARSSSGSLVASNSGESDCVSVVIRVFHRRPFCPVRAGILGSRR